MKTFLTLSLALILSLWLSAQFSAPSGKVGPLPIPPTGISAPSPEVPRRSDADQLLVSAREMARAGADFFLHYGEWEIELQVSILSRASVELRTLVGVILFARSLLAIVGLYVILKLTNVLGRIR